MPQTKVVSLAALSRITADARRDGKTVVHCHGVFDLLHIGHIRYLEQAKTMGNLLVVTLTPDRYVDKGPHRPAFPEILRAEAIGSLSCVDYVAINEWPMAEETLRLLKPDVYVKGSEFKGIASDMTGKIGREAEVVREIGARLAFTDDIVFSSTHLINAHLSLYPKEVAEYLELFRKRHSLDEVLEVIERMSAVKVLVIGDAIIDEYVYGEAIGKSSKDPVLAVRYASEDRFAGGVLAVANHAADFAGRVELLTVLGTRNSHEAFIRSSLDERVKATFVEAKDRQTVCKRRVLEGNSLNKLLELYYMDEREVDDDVAAMMSKAIEERMQDVDLLLVADFGHGTITPRMVETFCSRAPFLAVNTQANAGNRGFHTISRYPRADYVCIAEHELRLDARDARGEIRSMMIKQRNRLQCRSLVVTRGRSGCLMHTSEGHFLEVPAFARNVVDRVGAGDAFLAITSLGAVQGVNFEILGFLGNVVGAEAVQIVGNAKAIDKMGLKKHVTSLLK